MTKIHVRRFLVSLELAAFCLVAWPVRPVEAACNMPTVTNYPSTIGGIDSPFLLPSQPRTITGPGAFADTDSVSLVYVPPGSPPSLIVVRKDCSTFSSAACAMGTPSIPTIYCATVTPTVGTSPDSITFQVPGYAGEVGPGGATTITPVDPGMVYRTGPVRLIVSSSATPPCKYADPNVACPATADPGMKACVDKLGAAVPAPPPQWKPQPFETIETVTGLPGINDFSLLCDTSTGDSVCKGTAPDLKLAVDARGSMLIPMQWTHVLRKSSTDSAECPIGQGLCDKREVVAWTTLPAWNHPPIEPISFPAYSPKVAQSFNLDGRTFGGQAPDLDIRNPGKPDQFRLGGTSDKHFSVIRILRCVGGDQACAGNPPKFDVASRMEKSVGPIKVPKTKKCDNANKVCKSDHDCPGGHCVIDGVGGSALDYIGPVPVPAAPPPTPAKDDHDWPYWLLLLAAVGLGWLWFRSS